MGHYCPFILSLGFIIAIGIFTRTALWYSWGEYLITLPHGVLTRVGISCQATGKLVAFLFIISSLNGMLRNVMELGGFEGAAKIMLSFEEFSEDANRPIINALISSALAVLVWAFILHYYTTQQDLHQRITKMQQQRERSFVENHCLQFRQEFVR